MKLSIVIPTYNESSQIEQCLYKLKSLRKLGHEVIVVDGGSIDDTKILATPLSNQVIQSEKSRSIQMNKGASIATGNCLLFLHADTVLPGNVINIFSKIENIESKWGRFDIKLTGRAYMFRIIERSMNIRSRLTGIATGDQVIFIGKELFKKVAGYPEVSLMEDIAISKILAAHSKPICLREIVVSSSRRWEANGVIKTILMMWLLRFLYFFNYDTGKIAKLYQ